MGARKTSVSESSGGPTGILSDLVRERCRAVARRRELDRSERVKATPRVERGRVRLSAVPLLRSKMGARKTSVSESSGGPTVFSATLCMSVASRAKRARSAERSEAEARKTQPAQRRGREQDRLPTFDSRRSRFLSSNCQINGRRATSTIKILLLLNRTKTALWRWPPQIKRPRPRCRTATLTRWMGGQLLEAEPRRLPYRSVSWLCFPREGDGAG